MINWIKKFFKDKNSHDYVENIQVPPLLTTVFDAYNSLSLFKRWEIKIAKGASVQELKELEQSTNFVFPSDFKEYYSLSNGFLDWDMANAFTLWPTERIISEYRDDYNINPDFITIADYLINCHSYGYIKGKEGIFKDYDEVNPICKNFNEFLGLLITDSHKMY